MAGIKRQVSNVTYILLINYNTWLMGDRMIASFRIWALSSRSPVNFTRRGPSPLCDLDNVTPARCISHLDECSLGARQTSSPGLSLLKTYHIILFPLTVHCFKQLWRAFSQPGSSLVIPVWLEICGTTTNQHNVKGHTLNYLLRLLMQMSACMRCNAMTCPGRIRVNSTYGAITFNVSAGECPWTDVNWVGNMQLELLLQGALEENAGGINTRPTGLCSGSEPFPSSRPAQNLFWKLFGLRRGIISTLAPQPVSAAARRLGAVFVMSLPVHAGCWPQGV